MLKFILLSIVAIPSISFVVWAVKDGIRRLKEDNHYNYY